MFFEESLIFRSGGRSNYRIPNVIAANDGTLLAFASDRKDTLADFADEIALVYAKKPPDGTWSEVKTLVELEGWMCRLESAVYDDTVGKAIVFGSRTPVARKEFGTCTKEQLAEFERREAEAVRHAKAHGIRVGDFRLVSFDNGESWVEEAHTVTPVEQLHSDGSRAMVGGRTHGAAHGIRLRLGAHAGRLICPSRCAIGSYNDLEGLRKCVYNNAIYSDDHGVTWQASNCVQLCTGEGTLIERPDGSLLYNSRAYFGDRKRYLAASYDGGATWQDFTTDGFLIEDAYMGCNASFLRVDREELHDASLLPEDADGVTLFCNPRAETRRNMTICISFDSGRTWCFTKTVFEGPSAYSSLAFDKVSGRFCLIYAKGRSLDDNDPYGAGISAAEFDLAWLLAQ